MVPRNGSFISRCCRKYLTIGISTLLSGNRAHRLFTKSLFTLPSPALTLTSTSMPPMRVANLTNGTFVFRIICGHCVAPSRLADTCLQMAKSASSVFTGTSRIVMSTSLVGSSRCVDNDPYAHGLHVGQMLVAMSLSSTSINRRITTSASVGRSQSKRSVTSSCSATAAFVGQYKRPVRWYRGTAQSGIASGPTVPSPKRKSGTTVNVRGS
mmetsp:Transcript_47998/g.148101  ORF Transcript_47998/g.148101 Transcript_47998/m.148101 type:complete len:211 (+) Transcript_47998:266-898(+)